MMRWLPLIVMFATPMSLLAQPATPVEQPPEQIAFQDSMKSFATVAGRAPNNLGFAYLRHRRAGEVAGRYAINWIGRLEIIEPTPAWNARIAVVIVGADFEVLLANSASDTRHGGTLISFSSQMFSDLLNMRVGQRVRFSGQLVCVQETEIGNGTVANCPSIDAAGNQEALLRPIFTFRFDALTPIPP